VNKWRQDSANKGTPSRVKVRARSALKSGHSTTRGVSAAERVASQAKPGWKVVPEATRPYTGQDAVSLGADASVPELGRLKQKYFGASDVANGTQPLTSDTYIVQMEPTTGVDARVGRKAVVVSGNRVIVTQG